MSFELTATVQKALPHVSYFSAREYEEKLYQEQMVCLFFFEKHLNFLSSFSFACQANYSIAINH